MSLRFPLISLLVVVSSHLRRHRLSLLASLPPLVVLILAPVPHVCRSCPPHVSCAFVPSPVFLCDFLSLSSPFFRHAGRGVVCLLASFIAGLVSLSRSLISCPLCLLAPLIVLDRSLRLVRLLPIVRAHRIGVSHPSPPVRLASPVFRQAWAGSVAARSRCACLIVLVWRFLPIVRAADGGGWMAAAGRFYLLGVAAGGGCCVWFMDVVVCIYRFGACSCMIVGVERKRLREDFRRWMRRFSMSCRLRPV